MEMARPTTLPDDVVLEILARLDDGDVATLFRCATACKGWRRLVAEPSFLLRRRGRWPPSLVGFFTQRSKFTRTYPGDGQLTFVPLHRPSPLGTRCRRLSSFLAAENTIAPTVINRSVPLGARGGLLVVRLFPHDQDIQPDIVRLAVCNLRTGTWDVLPEVESNTQFRYSSDPYSCEILPSSDGTAFKVVMIGKDNEKSQFNLHTFSSGKASWRDPIKCFHMMEQGIWPEEHRKAVMCGGFAHWLFVGCSNYFHVLSYNVETEHVSLKKLLSPTNIYPPTMYEDYLRSQRAFSGTHLSTTAGGTLLALRMYSGGQMEIWTHDQDNVEGDAKWERTRVIDHKLTDLILQLEKPYCIWSGEKSSTLLIKDDAVRRFYKAYLNNGRLEDVTKQFPTNHFVTIMPTEIDWPTFFVLCLGGPW